MSKIIATDDGFALISQWSGTSNSADISSSGDFLTFDIPDITVVETGAASIPEPASFVLVLSALLEVVLTSPRYRYPARRYCTASSLRNK